MAKAAQSQNKLKGVENPELGECLEKLKKCNLFTDLIEIIRKSKEIGSQKVFILTYQVGDPIICTVDESELRSHKTYPVQKQPESQFVLPSQGPFEAASVGNGTLAPIGSSLGLKSNPLFIVNKGRVEIYQWVPAGQDDDYVPVPLITSQEGEAFGEFEIDISQKNPSWVEYAADVTAGWRTACCWPSLPKEQKSYKLLTGVSYHGDKDLADVGLFLHRSVRHLLQGNAHQRGATELIVVPRPVLDMLINESSAFLRSLYAFMWSHLRVAYQRSYLRNLAGMRAYRDQEEIKKYFGKYVLQPCCVGLLPILVPCTEFHILKSWYTAFNDRVKEVMKKRRVLKPPYFFFVPNMVKIAIPSGDRGSYGPEDSVPILSRSMIRHYTSDLVLAGSGKTLEIEMFATESKAEASGAKGKGKRETKSLSYEYIEPFHKTQQDRKEKLKSLGYAEKNWPKNFWDTDPQTSIKKPELVRVRLEDIPSSGSTLV